MRGKLFLVISLVVFRVSLSFCFSFSLLCKTFLSLYLQKHSNQVTEGIGYLLIFFFQGEQSDYFLLACLCSMPDACH